MDYSRLIQWLIVVLLPAQLLAFGNEYVHIKVHVPKDHALDAGVPSPSHNVIHHFHHRQRSRVRPGPKLKTSPLVESVILSDLDRPSHINEHTEYLNHAKQLAEHLSESYVVKKPPPSPPPPPKKTVSTYTIIEEKPRFNGFEHNARPEPYHVIDTRPQQYHSHSYQHENDEEDADDTGYHYAAPNQHYRHKSVSTESYHNGKYAEPAPVEELTDADQDYSYTAPIYDNTKSAGASTQTHDAPGESYVDSSYQNEYDVDARSSSSSGFRPSQQLYTHSDSYENVHKEFAPTVTTHRRRPSTIEWPSHSAHESYNDASHIKRVGSRAHKYFG